MIQVITVTAHAVCLNCQGGIHRGKGDLDRVEHWWHDSTGRTNCPSPEADPDPASIRTEHSMGDARDETWAFGRGEGPS